MNPRPQLRSVLSTKLGHVAAMLVEHEEPWLVHQRMAGTDRPVENVEISSARYVSSRVQRLVEAAKCSQDIGRERHVCAGAKVARAARIQRVSRRHRAVAHALETATKAAAFLENDLRLRLELHWEDLSGEGRSIPVRIPGIAQAFEPPPIHDDVVVQEREDLSAGLAKCPVACEVQARPRLSNV